MGGGFGGLMGKCVRLGCWRDVATNRVVHPRAQTQYGSIEEGQVPTSGSSSRKVGSANPPH